MFKLSELICSVKNDNDNICVYCTIKNTDIIAGEIYCISVKNNNDVYNVYVHNGKTISRSRNLTREQIISKCNSLLIALMCNDDIVSFDEVDETV